MALVIDSTDEEYITKAKTALNTLLGGSDQALTYTKTGYSLGGLLDSMGMAGAAIDRYVIAVTEGPQFNSAQRNRPHSATLVHRVIASAHWTRIIYHGTNDASPDQWLMDRMWSGFKSFMPEFLVKPDAGFMKKVMTTGSSCAIRWSGNKDVTANLSHGIIQMGEAKPYILLAHELIHADRITRGLYLAGRGNSTFLVDERQKSDPTHPGRLTHQANQESFTSAEVQHGQLSLGSRKTIANTGNVITTVTSGPIWVDGTMESTEEIATVGLSDDDGVVPNDALAITENMIRAEHGEPKRLKYGRFTRKITL